MQLQPQPQVAVFIGTAGVLKRDHLRHGDVIIADIIAYYTMAKLTAEGRRARLESRIISS